MQIELQAYANGHIETSFEFLLMSTHFGNFESNRDGFKKFYRKLSDSAWEKSIDLIKYITKRGGSMNFNQLPHFKKNVCINYYFKTKNMNFKYIFLLFIRLNINSIFFI
jgi:ferritin